MNSNQKVSYPIAATLGANAAGVAYVAANGTASTDEEIPEVAVTATRRTENPQDVSIAITALTSEIEPDHLPTRPGVPCR
jgi:outer membrane receptor protein involved in Fe transport